MLRRTPLKLRALYTAAALSVALLLTACPGGQEEPEDPLGWREVRSEVLDVQFRYPSAFLELKRESESSKNQLLAESTGESVTIGEDSGDNGPEPGTIPGVKLWFIGRRTRGLGERFNATSRDSLNVVAGLRNRRYNQSGLEFRDFEMNLLREDEPVIWRHRLTSFAPQGELPFTYPASLRSVNDRRDQTLHVEFFYLFPGDDVLEIEVISETDLREEPRVEELVLETVRSIRRASDSAEDGSEDADERDAGDTDEESEAQQLPTVNEVSGWTPEKSETPFPQPEPEPGEETEEGDSGEEQSGEDGAESGDGDGGGG